MGTNNEDTPDLGTSAPSAAAALALAKFIIQTANASAPNAQALAALATGYMKVATATGIITSQAIPIPATDGGTGVNSLSNLKSALGYPSNIEASFYLPGLTNVANISASTAYQCQYLRVGPVVFVSGKVDIDPVAALQTTLGISLPIASNIGAVENCAGICVCPSLAGQAGAIVGDAANDRANLTFVAADITNQPMFFAFGYLII